MTALNKANRPIRPIGRLRPPSGRSENRRFEGRLRARPCHPRPDSVVLREFLVCQTPAPCFSLKNSLFRARSIPVFEESTGASSAHILRDFNEIAPVQACGTGCAHLRKQGITGNFGRPETSRSLSPRTSGSQTQPCSQQTETRAQVPPFGRGYPLPKRILSEGFGPKTRRASAACSALGYREQSCLSRLAVRETAEPPCPGVSRGIQKRLID